MRSLKIIEPISLPVYPVLLGTGKRFFAEGTPARSFEPTCGGQAHQHASISVRHHFQYLQGRWDLEDLIVRGRGIVSEQFRTKSLSTGIGSSYSLLQPRLNELIQLSKICDSRATVFARDARPEVQFIATSIYLSHDSSNILG